jgi:chemotaxis protein methyltransferase CheR
MGQAGYFGREPSEHLFVKQDAGKKGAGRLKGSIPSPGELLVDQIAGMAGLSLAEFRQQEAESGILRIMERHGVHSMCGLLERLEGDTRLLDEVVDELTVKETYFFRDSLQFDTVRSSILPALLVNRDPEAPIRVWSAGCSTGEEPYSLAIMLEEEGLGGRAEIIATDISKTALAMAKRAEYGEWSMRDTPLGFKERYFTRHGDHFRLHTRLKELVAFHRLNLETDECPCSHNATERFDLIFCRNVLMYYDKDAVARLSRRLFDCLDDGGWLVCGPSDPPLWEHAPFETETTAAGLIYLRAGKEMAKAPALPQGPQPSEDAGSSYATDQLPARRGLPARTEAIRKLIQTGEAGTEEDARSQPLSPELHYLQGKASLEAGMKEAAVAAFRRAIYLDHNLAAAHFLLAATVQDDNPSLAVRAYSNAAEICEREAPLDTVPLCGETTYGFLAGLARQRIAVLTQAGAL